MTSRARHEHQIILHDYWAGTQSSFERALNRVVVRAGGLDFFTDEQLADIREQMIRDAWFSHKLKRENRNRARLSASLSASQKEHANVEA